MQKAPNALPGRDVEEIALAHEVAELRERRVQRTERLDAGRDEPLAGDRRSERRMRRERTLVPERDAVESALAAESRDDAARERHDVPHDRLAKAGDVVCGIVDPVQPAVAELDERPEAARAGHAVAHGDELAEELVEPFAVGGKYRPAIALRGMTGLAVVALEPGRDLGERLRRAVPFDRRGRDERGVRVLELFFTHEIGCDRGVVRLGVRTPAGEGLRPEARLERRPRGCREQPLLDGFFGGRDLRHARVEDAFRFDPGAVGRILQIAQAHAGEVGEPAPAAVVEAGERRCETGVVARRMVEFARDPLEIARRTRRRGGDLGRVRHGEIDRHRRHCRHRPPLRGIDGRTLAGPAHSETMPA